MLQGHFTQVVVASRAFIGPMSVIQQQQQQHS